MLRRIRGDVFALFDEFDGTLLYYPDIVPVTRNFGLILSNARKDPRELLELGPRDFEHLVADIWKKLGYNVELTSQTRDGGRDIIALREGELNLRVLIECKRYSSHRKVGVSMVRELYGVKQHEKATKAILATTSRFSPEAKDFFRHHIWELEPRDFDGVVDWIKLACESRSL